jgi:hypothetical protein
MRRRKTSALVVVALVAASGLSFAQSTAAWAGTWRLNVAKSKYTPGPAPKSSTLRLEAFAGGSKTVLDKVNADGSMTRNEVSAMFDGKEYEVRGAAAPTTRAYKSADRGYEFVTRVSGKVTTTTRVVASADGKTLTATQTGTNAQGQAVNNVLVYERQ